MGKDTYEKLEGEGEICRVEDSHGADIWQFRVYVWHGGSEATDYSLNDVEVREEQEVSPMSYLSHLMRVIILTLHEWILVVVWRVDIY